MNTAIVATAMGLLTYTVWNYSAEREVRNSYEFITTSWISFLANVGEHIFLVEVYRAFETHSIPKSKF